MIPPIGRYRNANDPYFANVSMLMNGDALTDVSGYHHSITLNSGATGSPFVDTTDSDFPFGAMHVSKAFGYANIVLFGSEMDFGAGDFTVEFDYKALSYISGNDPSVLGMYSSFGANGGVAFFDNPSFASGNFTMVGNGHFPIGTVATSLNELHQIAYSRIGTSLFFFDNGVLQATITGSTDHFLAQSHINFGTNDASIPNCQFEGLIGKVRVTKGVGRYATNYTTSRALFPTS